ncbi:protein-tyrosine phosphatase-like protein [Cytidiella melzeri]|nr:protein-tyrosine phosphatase-like protein [Cytidiella melzeri]
MQTSLPPTEIIPRLYMSDLAAAESPTIITHFGITHVVSVMRGAVSLPATPIPLSWLQIPITDNPFSELAEHLPGAVSYISRAMQDPRARVLVHCVQGVSRSASVICAFLIKEYHYAPMQAVQYVKSRRPNAEPNSGFITQLGEYAESLRR